MAHFDILKRFSLPILTIVLLVFAATVNAQKVVVVLSGGGAKGLAHIGAMKALEEHGIPIDYVIGSSMGGIIGGMYAAGYSPEEMEDIVTQAHFQQWLKGILNEKNRYFYSSRLPNPSIFTLDLSVDSSFTTTVNNNIANDHAINFVFAEMLAQASHRAGYDFDSLMVPFRTVASDIFLQKEEVLKYGYLNEAVRATMTVPLFYRPIRVNNKYLFDGGIYNNFPVDLAKKEFNPDYVIGVNVSSTKMESYPYEDDDKLLSESLAFLFLKKSDPESIGRNGIYIEPNLEGYSSLSFGEAQAIIDSGYNMTKVKIPEIKAATLRKISKSEFENRRTEFKEGFKPLLFGDIRLTGFSYQQRKFVRRIFNKKSAVIRLDQLKSGYYKLVSESYFKNIFPNIVFNDASGLFDLEISAKQAKNFKVNFGGNIATRSIGQMYLGMQLNHFHGFLGSYEVNFFTGRFYQSIQARPRINLPSKKLFYIEPEITLNSWDFGDGQDLLFKNDPNSALIQIDRKYALNVGIAIGNKGKIEIHSSHLNNTDRFSNIENLAFSDTLDIFNFKGFRQGITYTRNTLNRKQYPDKGSSLMVSLDFFSGKERYTAGSTSLLNSANNIDRNWYRFISKAEKYYGSQRFKYGFLMEAVISNQPTFTNFRSTLINAPAFYPLQDSRSKFLANYRAFNYVAGGIRNVYRVLKWIDLRTELYVFKPFETIHSTEFQQPITRTNTTNLNFVGNINAVYHSLLGPVSLSFNYYHDEDPNFGILMHIGFILYNKKSME